MTGASVAGLAVWTSEYFSDFLSTEEQGTAVDLVQHLEFRQDTFRGQALRRRQADFGLTYGPGGQVEPAAPIPSSLGWILDRVGQQCGVSFEQLIVTWYQPGASIGAHSDDKWFGEPIAGLSLGAPCIFRRIDPGGDLPSMKQELTSGSLYVLRGDERWMWKHDIPASSIKGDRWSLTFRLISDQARLIVGGSRQGSKSP